MRPIKFRGLNKRTNEWKYGSLQNYEDGSCCIISDIYNSHELWAVHPDTVGQYTGFKDRDGVEIYEGDIVLVKDSVRTECTWSNGFHLYGKTYDNDRGYYDYCFTQDLKVIGNIHQKHNDNERDF